MPNEPIQPGLGDLYGDAPAQRVYTRTRWLDEWTRHLFLYARTAKWASSPDRPSAELEWRFGVEKQAGDQDYRSYSAADWIDQYVKIEVDQSDGTVAKWYGIVTDWTEARGGVLTHDGDKVTRGSQVIHAVGLEHLWERVFVDGSIVQTYPEGNEFPIRQPLTFNQPHGFGSSDPAVIQGNRSLQPAASGEFLFSNDLDNAITWTTLEIVRYIVQRWGPAKANGFAPFIWALTTGALNALPDWDKPVIEADGRTAAELLDQLCDRRRNLSWHITVDDNNLVLIDVFTFIEIPIVLPGGGVVAGNSNTTTFDFDGAVDVYPQLRKAGMHNIDQVVVRGERKRAVVSLSHLDDSGSGATLIADWSDSDETDYEEVSALDPSEQENATLVASYRMKDNLERVFSWFRLPADWDGTVGNGDGSNPKVAFFPNDPDWGIETVYLPTLRFERKLPRGLIPSARDGSPEREAAPFGLIKYETGSEGEPDRYAFVEKLALTSDEFEWACSFRIQKDAPGVILTTSRAPQHFIAGEDFDPLDGDDTPPLAWKDVLIVTVMLELDAKVLGVYPSDDSIDSLQTDAVKRVHIDVGDRARLDWVTANTVIGLTGAGELAYPDEGYYIRDDRTFLADLARFAFEWYGVERRAFDFSIAQLTAKFSVGQIITTIGNVANGTQETVNAVVTGVSFDLVNGSTQVTTDFPEVDFTQV